MANVAHSSLTGSNLHENKGAASATDDHVATATTGATVWKKLTASNLTGTGNSFGAQLLHVQDQKTQGTNGGGNTAGSYVDRVLNTVVTNEISSASLTNNKISLPAGTYYIDASSPMHGSVTAHRSALYNHTSATYLIYGTNEYAFTTSRSFVVGRFTLAGTSEVGIRYYAAAEQGGTNGLGNAIGAGVEIYTDVKIWKLV
jgi:hypothetical protein